MVNPRKLLPPNANLQIKDIMDLYKEHSQLKCDYKNDTTIILAVGAF